ncbi:MAG: TonB-dependent receptor [Bacteroidota bacterium]|nr:TonB-dependent receptor [Bacteroidota bacterium]
MKKIIFVILILPIFTAAQNKLKVKIKDADTKTNLSFVSAYSKQIKAGAVSDSNGIIILSKIPDGKYEFVFSLMGYEKKEIEFSFPLKLIEAEIFLKKENENLDEVVITSTRTNSRIKDIPIRVEVIGEDEVNEEGSMKPANISMLLAESPGIQTQQTSAINGNVSIRLQGLDGKYTQILKDGFPLYGGFSQGLSIMQIPPLDLKQVEIIKGSSGSLYGSDAIAGLVNLISKQPQEKRYLNFLFNQTSLGAIDANGYFSQRWKKLGLTFLSSNNFQKATDVNKDGFSDLPKTKAYTIDPAIYYYFDSTATLRIGINATHDYRKGGDMFVLNTHTDSLHQYFEEDISNRISSQLKFDKQFNKNTAFTFKNSISLFDRAINQNAFLFEGKQISSYTEMSVNYRSGKHQWVAGINYISEKFTEDSSKSHLSRNYHYETTGVFLQDDWKMNQKIAILTGLRTDYQNQYGIFILPSIALMYKLNKEFYVRIGSGFGYTLPSIFSTGSEQVGINTIQPLSSNVKAEKSIAGNIDLNWKKRLSTESTITFNQSFFFTQINDPLVLDSILFVTKSQPIIASGFETNIRLKIDELQVFFGYVFADAQRKYDAQQPFIPLTPKHKINADIIYEKEEKFSVAMEGYYISSMFRDFDIKTKEFMTFGLIVQKYFKHLSIIANCENIFDIRQTRFENIIIPPVVNPTFRDIYAPLDGRVFNLAVRIKI